MNFNTFFLRRTKCKGVLGSIMAIKHLAQKSESQEQALEIFSNYLDKELK